MDVFYHGYGWWYEIINEKGDCIPLSGIGLVNGVFKLCDCDALKYKHSKSLAGVIALLPSSHPDDELSHSVCSVMVKKRLNVRFIISYGVRDDEIAYGGLEHPDYIKNYPRVFTIAEQASPPPPKELELNESSSKVTMFSKTDDCRITDNGDYILAISIPHLIAEQVEPLPEDTGETVIRVHKVEKTSRFSYGELTFSEVDFELLTSIFKDAGLDFDDFGVGCTKSQFEAFDNAFESSKTKPDWEFLVEYQHTYAEAKRRRMGARLEHSSLLTSAAENGTVKILSRQRVPTSKIEQDSIILLEDAKIYLKGLGFSLSDEMFQRIGNPQTETAPKDGAGNGDTKPASIKPIQDDIKTYELYKNSLDALVKSGINLKPLTVRNIFNQVKITDKELWTIKFSTFTRDVWPIYSKENDLKKQGGRPRTK